jgi:WXG100 family type VII secretion target
MSDNEGGRSLEVDELTLHQAAREIRSAKADIDNHLGTIRGAAEVLGVAWTGQAAGAFTNLMERWNNDARQLAAAMEDIAVLLDRSAKSHSLNDEQSMSMLNRMDSSVDSIIHPNP